jgi:hypothetical protein
MEELVENTEAVRAIGDTPALSPEDRHGQVPYLRWLRDKRPDLYPFAEMQLIHLARPSTIARNMGCSDKEVNAALDEARKAYDIHVLVRKLERLLGGAVLPEDRRAIAEAVRAFTPAQPTPDCRRP